MIRSCALLCVTAALVWGLDDAVAALPKLAKPQPSPTAALIGVVTLGQGVGRINDSAVVLDGVVQLDQGPLDGLELFACLNTGKTHESVVRLDSNVGQLVKAACIATLGLPDGIGGEEGSGAPARGVPVRLTVRWTNEDGGEVAVDASSLVRDRISDQAYPALPFIYVGSHFATYTETGEDGQPRKREVFVLDVNRTLATNYDFADALLGSPFPYAADDTRFEVNSRICPPVGTKVRLVISHATMPLTLGMDEQGRLTDANGAMLDDHQLASALVAAYGAGATPGLRALAVHVPPAVERSKDRLARSRILALAAQAKTWVVPVFVPVTPGGSSTSSTTGQ